MQSSAGIFSVSMETQRCRRSGSAGEEWDDVQEAAVDNSNLMWVSEMKQWQEESELLYGPSVPSVFCLCLFLAVCVWFLHTFSLSHRSAPSHTGRYNTGMNWTVCKKTEITLKTKAGYRENSSRRNDLLTYRAIGHNAKASEGVSMWGMRYRFYKEISPAPSLCQMSDWFTWKSDMRVVRSTNVHKTHKDLLVFAFHISCCWRRFIKTIHSKSTANVCKFQKGSKIEPSMNWTWFININTSGFY